MVPLEAAGRLKRSTGPAKTGLTEGSGAASLRRLRGNVIAMIPGAAGQCTQQFVVLLLGACTSGSIAPKPQTSMPPTIVLMIVEDLDPSAGASGDDPAKMPTLDALAAEGLRVKRLFTTSAVCAPRRAMLICGMHQG